MNVTQLAFAPSRRRTEESARKEILTLKLCVYMVRKRELTNGLPLHLAFSARASIYVSIDVWQ